NSHAQIDLNPFNVASRIDPPIDVHDRVAFEATDHVNDRVRFANGVQELIAHAFALRRAAHQSGDIYEFDAGRNDHFSLDDFGERSEPLIRYCPHADVWLAGRKRIVGD